MTLNSIDVIINVIDSRRKQACVSHAAIVAYFIVFAKEIEIMQWGRVVVPVRTDIQLLRRRR